MKVVSHKLYIFFVLLHFSCLLFSHALAESRFDPRVTEALERAGENKEELLRALKEMPGRDMEHLITHARSFDLVNLSAEILVTTLKEARLSYTNTSFISPKYDYEIWRDYVLPYRVMEEDLSNWRPFLRMQLGPVIKNSTSVPQVAKKIFRWIHAPAEDGKPRIRFVATENRNQNPFQLLANRNGGCKEIHITYVCALRSVGIPARLCTNAWWTTADWYHYFVQYYDPAIGDWRGIDASNTAGMDPSEWNEKKETWHVMKAYAFPSYPSVKDVDGMQRWDLCTDITEYLCETGTLIIRSEFKEPYAIGLYTWNIGAWRLIGKAKASPRESVSITIGETKADRLLLVSAISKNDQALSLTEIKPRNVTYLQMQPGTTQLRSAPGFP